MASFAGFGRRPRRSACHWASDARFSSRKVRRAQPQTVGVRETGGTPPLVDSLIAGIFTLGLGGLGKLALSTLGSKLAGLRAAGLSADIEGFTLVPSGTGLRIFRAVEPDELADLLGSAQYRNIPGVGDGKYFFPTPQQADTFAEMMTTRGMGGPYCTTLGCIPAHVMGQIERITPAGEGAAYFVPDTLLPYIDNVLVHG